MMMQHHEMGKWWKNSDVAQKLQLSNAQLTKLDRTFYDHRLKLIDLHAEVEKQNLKLQSLLDADRLDEAQINAQADQLLEARGRMEREFTLMTLDLRRVLSTAQWRQLQSIRAQRGADRMFFHAPGAGGPASPPPPGVAPGSPPPPQPDDNNL
jgi:Spy/CpxP family protein refolding chaperone